MKKSLAKSICVLRLSAIGDCINALAAIQCLQRELGPSQLTWIIGKTEASLFQKIPGIDLVVFDKKAGFQGMLQVKKQLKHQKFDVLLDMQTALRASMLSLFIDADSKLGFDAKRSSDCQRLFTSQKVPSPENPHVLDGFMAFAQAAGCEDITPSWNFYLDEEDLAVANENIIPGEKTVIISPCSSKKFKNWTTIGYVETAKYAISRGFKVLLCGGPSFTEQQVTTEIAQAVNSDQLKNLAGKTTLRQMLGLISKASMLIAPDSGPVHMANAVGTPVIGLYAHHNPLRVGPRNFLNYAVSVYNECIKAELKNSNTIKWRTRVHDKSAMQKINTIMVRNSFDRICADFNLE